MNSPAACRRSRGAPVSIPHDSFQRIVLSLTRPVSAVCPPNRLHIPSSLFPKTARCRYCGGSWGVDNLYQVPPPKHSAGREHGDCRKAKNRRTRENAGYGVGKSSGFVVRHQGFDFVQGFLGYFRVSEPVLAPLDQVDFRQSLLFVRDGG